MVTVKDDDIDLRKAQEVEGDKGSRLHDKLSGEDKRQDGGGRIPECIEYGRDGKDKHIDREGDGKDTEGYRGIDEGSRSTLAKKAFQDIGKNWMMYAIITISGIMMIVGIYGGYEVGSIQACNLQGYVPGLQAGGQPIQEVPIQFINPQKA